jgi:DNA-binding CsgD family transcriptional regulator
VAAQNPGQADNERVPEPADAARERKRAAYEAARRRSAVNLMRIMACTLDYASERLSNGADPREAQETMEFTIGELASVAASLRRLEGLTPAQRRVRAAQLTRLGMSRAEVGRRLGVSAKTVRNYLRAAAPETVRPPPWR